MTLLCTVKLTRHDSTEHGPGWDWHVQVGTRDVQGWTAGPRAGAWHDVVTIANMLHGQTPEAAA